MLYVEWFSFNPFKAHCYTAEEIQRLSARLELRLDKVITESAALEKRIRERQTASAGDLTRLAVLNRRLDVLNHQAIILQKLMRGTIAFMA